MKQLLQIRCWNCHDVFTMSAELNTDRPAPTGSMCWFPALIAVKPIE